MAGPGCCAWRVSTSTPDTTPDDAAWAINLFTAALTLTAFICLDSWLIDTTGTRLALLAAAVTVVAERTVDPRPALGCAVLAFALGNGFLQNHTGNLVWSASIDYPFTLALFGGAALGLSLGQARLAWRRHRLMHPFRMLLDDVPVPGADRPSRGRREYTPTGRRDPGGRA